MQIGCKDTKNILNIQQHTYEPTNSHCNDPDTDVMCDVIYVMSDVI